MDFHNVIPSDLIPELFSVRDRVCFITGAGGMGEVIARAFARNGAKVALANRSPEKAERIGVRLASLEEIFAECDVISNHLANKKEIEGIISRPLLFSMKKTATLINTGRGAQLDEDALCDFLAENPGAAAVLDVTDPEPVPAGSRRYTLPNLVLTPHIAGSYGNEVVRLAEYMLNEFDLAEEGSPCRWQVFPDMLKTMA